MIVPSKLPALPRRTASQLRSRNAVRAAAAMTETRTKPHRSTLWGAALVALLTACGSPTAQTKSYSFIVLGESDPEMPLSGIEVRRGNDLLARTGNDGSAVFEIEGVEGRRIPLTPVCPTGHRSTQDILTVVLKTYATGGTPKLQLRCPPKERHLAVAVRFKQGAHLPILHRSRVLATTDANGTAHLLLKGEAGDDFELQVDTSQTPDLRPQNPSARFTITDGDEIQLFEQDFLLPKRKVRRRQGPQLPVLIK